LTAAISASASSDVSITVDATLAPNAYGSPSYDAWIANAADAMQNSLASYGAAGPTQFNAVNSPLPTADNLVTGFPSWLGQANPTGAYANELGNRASFVGLINGGSGAPSISIANLGFTTTSSDAGNFLGNTWATGSLTYSVNNIGIIENADGSVTLVTSGPATTLVNEIIAIHGNAPAAYAGDIPGDPTATYQQIIDYDLANNVPGSYDLTGDYTYGDASGAVTMDLGTPVPEPATIIAGMSMLLPFGASALRILRKRQTA
jgi:hypothetical protein